MIEAVTKEEPWGEEPWTELETAQGTESARPGEGVGENLEGSRPTQLPELCDSVAGDGIQGGKHRKGSRISGARGETWKGKSIWPGN